MLPKNNIDMFLVHITATVLPADQHILQGIFNPHIKPYWKNSELNNAHYEMRRSRRAWKSEGSPRDPKQKEQYVKYKHKKRTAVNLENFIDQQKEKKKIERIQYLMKLTKPPRKTQEPFIEQRGEKKSTITLDTIMNSQKTSIRI